MKIFKVTIPAGKDAHELCEELEVSLGVNLMNKDPLNPNEVHGYMNTDGDGYVEVHLYEKEDADTLNAFPDQLHIKEEKRVVSIKTPGVTYSKSKKSDNTLHLGLKNHFKKYDGAVIHTDKEFEKYQHHFVALEKRLDKQPGKVTAL